MKHLFSAVALITVAGSACAAEGDVLARFRVINVNPDVSTDKTLSKAGVGVDDQTNVELDFTYMFTDHIGAELILGTTRHEVTSNMGSLGKVSVLPPTLTLQYHFNPEGQVRPYVGAGVNYTRFYNNGLKLGGENLSIDKNSWGGALQVGADIALSKDIFLNVDVKKVYISTDVNHPQLGNLGTLDIDPWIFGIGVGTRF